MMYYQNQLAMSVRLPKRRANQQQIITQEAPEDYRHGRAIVGVSVSVMLREEYLCATIATISSPITAMSS
jgi:hypothetical protein